MRHCRQGHVVSIPDPHGSRPSRSVIIISDDDTPDHPDLYTVCALTTNEEYGDTRYGIPIEADEPIEGHLLSRSFAEPWATERTASEDVRDVHARLDAKTMQRIAAGYAQMIIPG